jgi:hypothetical protein
MLFLYLRQFRFFIVVVCRSSRSSSVKMRYATLGGVRWNSLGKERLKLKKR